MTQSGERDLGGAPGRAGEDGFAGVLVLGAADALAIQQDPAGGTAPSEWLFFFNILIHWRSLSTCSFCTFYWLVHVFCENQ